MTRFIKAFEKRYSKELASFDLEKLQTQEAFAEMFHIIEQVEDEEGELIELPLPPRKRTQKARYVSKERESLVLDYLFPRSSSVSTQATLDDSDDDGKPAKPVRRQPARTPKTNRIRVILEEDEDEDEDEETSDSEMGTPT
jgi:hypothetical protein